MSEIAIIGAGISGLTCARMLKAKHHVVVFEKESMPGGLIRCKRVNGNLFHICGGHVFNSKRTDVLNWFWGIFQQEDFYKIERKSAVAIGNKSFVPYPIESHIHFLPESIQRSIIRDWMESIENQTSNYRNFEEFLIGHFGKTLYDIYFKPYNSKIWRSELSSIPIEWLDGKLPSPTVSEMLFDNINHLDEKRFVHSSFWYEKESGSQFLANTLASGLEVRYNATINIIQRTENGWNINGSPFDIVIFCGNIKHLISSIKGLEIPGFCSFTDDLKYHGTTSVFCELQQNPYTWIYQPDTSHNSHRIICTGNFSPSNNNGEKYTGTVEFTDQISIDIIERDLSRMPFSPKILDVAFTEYSYPIQTNDTRKNIERLKSYLKEYNLFFTGRFADWEYYNMDIAMGAAIDLCNKIQTL